MIFARYLPHIALVLCLCLLWQTQTGPAPLEPVVEWLFWPTVVAVGYYSFRWLSRWLGK